MASEKKILVEPVVTTPVDLITLGGIIAMLDDAGVEHNFLLALCETCEQRTLHVADPRETGHIACLTCSSIS